MPEQPSEFPQVDDAEVDPAALSFMQASRAASFWRHPLVRALLFLLALLLTLALLLQVAVQERDRLAAQFPAWRPALRALCEPLACRVGRLQQIESVVIDSSSFSKVAPGLYRLGFTLKNTVGVELALPALELMLTDAQEQALARRVLRSGELQFDLAVLPANSELSGSLMLSVQTPEDAAPLAGYRLLAFYP